MALVRVAQYGAVPGPVTDYQAQNAHLQAFTNQLLTQQFILDAGTAQPVIKQGTYVSHGGSLYVADADTAITGSPSDGSVYIRVSGTTTLTVEFINNISGYAWNPVYSALTSGSYTLLPYLIVKAGTVWTRYNFNPNNQSFGDTRLNSLAVTGAISGATVNTGHGANELYPMNQAVRTTDSPTFASINTGQGATEVYLMNQNLRTTDSPTFASVNTGQGATEVYRTTFSPNYSAQFFTADAEVLHVPNMNIGETAGFYIDSISSEGGGTVEFRTPELPSGSIYMVFRTSNIIELKMNDSTIFGPYSSITDIALIIVRMK